MVLDPKKKGTKTCPTKMNASEGLSKHVHWHPFAQESEFWYASCVSFILCVVWPARFTYRDPLHNEKSKESQTFRLVAAFIIRFHESL